MIGPSEISILRLNHAGASDGGWWRATAKVSTSMAAADASGDAVIVQRWRPLVEIQLERFRVIKETPKGVRLHLPYGGGTRFVLREARKRWACPTEKEALESLQARMRRRGGIMAHQVQCMEIGVNALTGVIQEAEDVSRC